MIYKILNHNTNCKYEIQNITKVESSHKIGQVGEKNVLHILQSDVNTYHIYLQSLIQICLQYM